MVQVNKLHIETSCKPPTNIAQLTPRSSLVVTRIIHNHDLARQACLGCHRQESSLNSIGRVEARDDDSHRDAGNICLREGVAWVVSDFLGTVGVAGVRQLVQVDEMDVRTLRHLLEDEAGANKTTPTSNEDRLSHGIVPPIIPHPYCHGDATLSSSDGPAKSIQWARASWSADFEERNSRRSSAKESLYPPEIAQACDSDFHSTLTSTSPTLVSGRVQQHAIALHGTSSASF